ncbi:hypothetical protein [Aliidiomarina indica]|uniref:hypothetical protein n=1 Tax=Aliidiomarina indica TaxID=2749147 RepID=UPI00188F4CC3|nr:hypothetical protein [Aliidiomarina indica]
MSISFRQPKKDTRSPIEKWADKLHLAEFPEEYDYTYDSKADAEDRRRGKNPMSAEYVDRVNTKRSLRGVGPLGDDGLPTDNASKKWALKKATRDFTVRLDNALFNNDPMGTCCVRNYCTDEYAHITHGIVARLSNEPLHQAILNELTHWFDAELVNREKVHLAVMATLTDLI